MTQSNLYIGLMSGTSADAVDAVLVDFAGEQADLIASHTLALEPDTRAAIHDLARPGPNEIDRMGALDHDLGQIFARTVNELLEKAGYSARQVTAIGSHGQTVRHRPPGQNERPFSLQIGDPNIIAHRTGITTIADFRRRDMAAGGHGAPLVPAFHDAFFHSVSENRAIVNVGGIANLTWLPTEGSPLGFDTGPGNVLMDAWIMRKRGAPYDDQGNWAATGQVNRALLQMLLEHPYFALPSPKSTGPEAFNLLWLDQVLECFGSELAAENVQATLLALTAQTVAMSVRAMQNGAHATVYLCGGGAYNLALRQALGDLLPQQRIADTSELGIAPAWVEATAFAWLARQTTERQTGNLPAVTGASQALVLGGIYPA